MIEENLESPKSSFHKARFSNNYEYIIDSNGNKVEYDDPRIVYVEPHATDPYAKKLVEHFYKINGKHIRFVEDTTIDTLQYAKILCSGRECIPLMATVGAILKDIHKNRGKDEITIYRLALEQEGPCENGGWPGMWEIFAKRLKVENVIFCGTLYKSKKYMGLNLRIYLTQLLFYMLGHVITETKNALYIISRNRKKALEDFEDATNRLIMKVEDHKKSLTRALKNWVEEISKIPCKADVAEMPKILILGGLNLLFVHYPYEDYFLENGIIPKVVDLWESSDWVLYEYIMKYNYKMGRINASKQINLGRLLLYLIFREHKYDALKAIFGRSAMLYFRAKQKKWCKIIGKTGLLFEEDISFKTLLKDCRGKISCFAFNETMSTTGRFIQSLKSNYYDGIVNLGAFNCQPAMNSQAIMRPLASKSEMPYLSIDCEGPWFSSNHLRLLETISVQAKRIREKKNKSINYLV